VNSKKSLRVAWKGRNCKGEKLLYLKDVYRKTGGIDLEGSKNSFTFDRIRGREKSKGEK